MSNRSFLSLAQQNLYDTFCRTTIPSVRKGTFLPLSGLDTLHLLLQSLRIFTHQDIATYADRLLMLCIAVQRDTRHTVERSFLGYITTIRDDTLGMSREPSEL